MEKQSGLELDWFKEYFVNTNHLPDYAVARVEEADRKQTAIVLANKGRMPMPVDVTITLKNGDKLHYTIPLRMMRGSKSVDGAMTFTTAPDWPWTHPEYTLVVDVAEKKIKQIEIDASGRMLDTDRSNNNWESDK
ncbi:MAG: hypothetical protein R2795_16175 [Saprospiraceae bacterium]